MHLSVTCPRCESKYQLDPSMRGKKMRCPNAICRAVFEVRADNDPPATAPPAPAIEKPAPPPDVKPAEPPAPPVPIPPAPHIKRRSVPKPVQPPPADDFPDDFPGDDEPSVAPTEPGVAIEAWHADTRQRDEASTAVAVEATRLTSEKVARPVSMKKVALWVMACMVLVLGTIVGVVTWRIQGAMVSNEADRFKRAEDLYQQRDFAEASSALQKLHRDFPDSPHARKYGFLAELSDVRDAAHGPRESAEERAQALQRVLQFMGVYRDDKLLKEREADVWETLADLAADFTRLSEQDKSLPALQLARRSWAEAKKMTAPVGVNPAERERKLSTSWTRLDEALAAHIEREHLLATLAKYRANPSALNVQQAWALAEKGKRQEDTEVRKLLGDLVNAHRESVRFVPTRADETPRRLESDDFASITVTPLVKSSRAVQSKGPLVLALARGVLYALDPAKGDVRWTRRVGIDTRSLPLRVPPDAITPELLLVFGSDQRSLSAVSADTGVVLWQSPLTDACVGTPIVIDRQVLVPTVAGFIEEIELAEGRRLGAYHVGQRLTLGGVRLAGTPLCYFPADEFCVYEVNASTRECTNILYTRHAPGSVRGLPHVYTEGKSGRMLWCQAKGADRLAIKPYALPIEQHDQKPLDPVVGLPAVSTSPWFQPDRLMAATPGGFLSVWGIRLPGTRDALLFPMLRQDVPIDEGPPGRCEVVHADAENIWTITRGRLQRSEWVATAKGPSLGVRWTKPVALGNLLHDVQVQEEGAGKKVLYLTTQSDSQPTCWASAVDAQTGDVLWQRQLGVIPRLFPHHDDATVLLRDAVGLVRFDADGQADSPWSNGGTWLSQDVQEGQLLRLLVQDKSYLQLSWPRQGGKFTVQTGPIHGDPKPRNFDVDLPAPPLGTPAWIDHHLFLPLASGVLIRVDLQKGTFINGPDWRAVGAEEHSPGHVLRLGSSQLLATDGSRGIHRFQGIDGAVWDKAASKQLTFRIIAPPTLLPGSDAGKARVCVADASDTVTLLDVERLAVLKQWKMPGKISGAPFVRAGRIGCIVGKNRLVWLDPERETPAWEYSFAADVVGSPELISGMLVVGDVAGQLLALHPETGRPMGPGIAFKADIAPATTPIPFGPDRALVPLTDGTLMVIPLGKLR